MIKKLLLLQFTIILGFILPAQICSYPTASAELNIGNVRARLMNGGDMWWDGVSSARYEVPKVDPASGNQSINAFLAGALWLSALDNDNDLKVAAMTFRYNNNYEFYPGPIDNITGTTTLNDCIFYDRFWEVYSSEIEVHINNTALGIPIPITIIPNSILEWPAKGNEHIIGQTINQDLAPFVDKNSNGKYEPELGDFPKIIGDQAFFWVMNDIGGFHGAFGGDPLKVEVQFMAYAFADANSILYNTTIYEAKIINKSFGNLHDLRVGWFSDPDLGSNSDDYVGCDTVRDASFIYNGASVDPQFGANPPILSIHFLNQEMSSFNFFVNGPSLVPLTYTDTTIYRFMQGQNYYGVPNCQSINAAICDNNFLVPGNPDIAGSISMNNLQSVTPADYRMLQNTGPHDFPAWSSFDLSFAVHTSFVNNYNVSGFYEEVGKDIDSVHAAYFNLLSQNPPTGIIANTSLSNQFFISPNPAQNLVQISFGELEVLEIQLVNVEGRIVKTENSNFGILDISELPGGIYFIKVKTKNGVGVQKMIKN